MPGFIFEGDEYTSLVPIDKSMIEWGKDGEGHYAIVDGERAVPRLADQVVEGEQMLGIAANGVRYLLFCNVLD